MPQYTFTADISLISEIEVISKREKRSRSEMIEILLQLAVREKNRKRKNVQKDSA